MPTAVAVKPSRPRLRRVTSGSLALAAGGVLLLTGCGSNSSSDTAAPQGGTGGQSAPSGQGGFGGNFTTGLIADVSGKTMQVQGTDSQTAVTYTSKTTFSEQAKVSAGAVKAGMCVVVQSGATGSSSTAVTATSVSVSAAVKGACTGRGGFGGAAGSGRPGGMPSGGPSAMPSGAPQGGRSGNPQGGMTPGTNGGNRGPGVSGKVSSVSGATITVAGTPRGSTKSQTYTVTTTATTTFTEEKTAKAGAVKVGKCVTAVGKTDSTGAVTATTVALRPAVGGKCSFGMGRPTGQQSNG